MPPLRVPMASMWKVKTCRLCLKAPARPCLPVYCSTLTLMYNCRWRTKVVPVRRRCCLVSPQCAHTLKAPCPPCFTAPFSLPNSQTTSIVYPPLLQRKPASTQLLHTNTSSFYYHPVPYLPLSAGGPCLPEAPCPASFNQVAPHSPQMPDNLPVQKRPSVTNTTSSHITQLPPEVRNRNLLNTMFKFKKDAPLRQFIQKNSKLIKNHYSLAEILTILKDAISKEKMFDERNPSVIICSNKLEAALNQKALHVTEVRNLVINQLERLEDQYLQDSQRSSQRSTFSQPRGNLQTAPPTSVHTASITSNTQTNKGSKFQLKPPFLEVVRTVAGVNPKQTVFNYQEITSILSKYILSRKNTLFDTRNIKLALVENDPLGRAFNVAAFHRCQVHSLLQTQLIPVQPNSSPDQLSTPTNKAPYSRVAILL